MRESISRFSGEYEFLSNFYIAEIRFGGRTYTNSEAAFQAQKCANEADRVRFEKMSPTEARHEGRKVTLRKDWEDVKVSIMRDIVRAKFMQHPELIQMLLATGDTPLEEGNNWGDRVWGTVGGVGANNLGKILMETRDELRQRVQQISGKK